MNRSENDGMPVPREWGDPETWPLFSWYCWGCKTGGNDSSSMIAHTCSQPDRDGAEYGL